MTNSDASATFASQSREVVESFLQTVVVLDDLAEMSPSSGRPMSGAPSEIVSPGDYRVVSQPARSEAPIDPDNASLDAQAVIAGFADIGSVCAVLSPDPDDESHERTIKAARRADIVILDWKIHDSYGNTTIDVMRKILEADGQQNRRLRLVAIYTGQRNLRDIFERIQRKLEEFYEGDESIEANDFRLSRGPLHVVILAKEGAIGSHQSELQQREVAERQLASRLADEFALMIGGLLRNVAIAGIAAIRQNAHRILAKFEQCLDPAYLGHRLLLHHPPDAEDHIVEALGSEVFSVLEEAGPGTRADVDAIGSWLAMRERQGVRLTDPFPLNVGHKPVERWRDLLLSGLEAPGNSEPGFTTKGKLQKRAAEPFAEDAEAAGRSNRRFAALLSLKTRYPGNLPRLAIGTLLCTGEGDEKNNFLCLQPKCDSVRLDTPSGFPLIPLIPLSDVKIGNQVTSLRLVVETGRGQWEEFGIEPKPSELTIRVFAPGPGPRKAVVADERDGQFFFKDVDGTSYRWIAEMKDEHALAVAGEVAFASARPGPNNAEWLRRASGSSQ